jgi:hypothetical protein
LTIANTLRNFLDALFPHRAVLNMSRQLEREREDRKADDARSKETLLAFSAMYRDRVADLKDQIDSNGEANGSIIKSLELEVEAARKERDYFKGRAERLELRILPDPVHRILKTRGVGETMQAARPRSWEQVQADNARKIRDELAEEAREKQEKESRPDAPKPHTSEGPLVEQAKQSPVAPRAARAGKAQPAKRGKTVRVEPGGDEGTAKAT